jgi:hypothetical protein
MNTGKVLQVPVWSAISAESISDESAATAKDTNTTQALITLSEHVVYHKITDMLRDSAYNDVFAQIGDQSGRAIAEALDAQVFSQFGDFSSDIGSAGHELVVADILKAAATLRSRKLTGPFYAVVHPGQAYSLKAQLATPAYYSGGNIANPSNVGNNILSGFYIGTVAGVQIFESALLTVDGSDDAVAAVFAPTAIGHAMRGGIDMNTLYQPKDRATDVVLKAVAGAKVIQAAHGVKITADTLV